MVSFEAGLKEEARRLGFDLVGIAAATKADDFAHFLHWLNQGYAGSMDYLERNSQPRQHPRTILESVRSVVMVALNYNSSPASSTDPLRPVGQIARYAGGQDYHEILWSKLDALLAWIQQEIPGTQGRGIVDTAPLLERDFARRAGLGWIGKNPMLINKHLGSYTFLGALLLDLPLLADTPFETAHCGTCTRCLDACPTDAFVGPYQLDARRCISYLTIELREPIPQELRTSMGNWIFGCDICQEVCPWNRKAPQGQEPALLYHRVGHWADLLEWLELSEEAFRSRFRQTPLWRSKRRGILRNVAVVLGNIGGADAIPALERAMLDREPLIQEAAQWAVNQIKRRLG